MGVWTKVVLLGALAGSAGAAPKPGEAFLPVQGKAEGYAQSLGSLSEATRAFERDPSNRYSYCIRSVATYECLSYGRSGDVRRQHLTSRAHGTGFAYQQKDGETLLLTNFHVADWPAVTDAQHAVEGVPLGCKKISDSLKIVDDEKDEYAADDLSLTRVVEDVALDAAVVKAKALLRTMPYRIGHSSQLKVGDAVTVQGFPLGVFRAVTHGQVINPSDHDHDGDWEHDDFIVDAALSSGNSGSPVLAVSKRTGEYELVGLFHAEYVSGHGLEAVIGIDQLRDLMVTLKRPAAGVAAQRAGPDLRAEFMAAIGRADFVPYLRLGNLTVGVRAAGPRLVYEIFSGSFPGDAQREALLVDAPTAAGFGELQSVLVAESGLYVARPLSQLDPDSQARLADFTRRLHEASTAAVKLRSLRLRAKASRQSQQDLDAELRAEARRAAGDVELVQAFADVVERAGGADASARPYEAVYTALSAPEPDAPLVESRIDVLTPAQH